MGLVNDRINQFRPAAAVNSQLTWGDVGAILIQNRPVRTAFLDAQMVMLPARTKLYKFNSHASLLPNDAGHVTGWWTSYDPYDVDPGLQAKLAMARHLRVSIRELGRVTSAITEGWNSCEFLVVIQLNVDIWAAYGRFRQQARVDDSGSKAITLKSMHNMRGTPDGPIREEGRMNTAHLPGGGRQFFVPNLKPDYLTIVQSECRSLMTM